MISLHVQVLIHWLSLSVLLTVLTSSSQSSAHVTLRLVTSFLLHWHSTYWQQLRSSFLVSLSFSTVLLQFLRSMLISSTSSVVSLPDAVGIPEEQLTKASESAVCKINIDSDSRLAFTAGVRETLALHPEYSTHVSTAVRLVSTWLTSIATRSRMFFILTTSWLTSTNLRDFTTRYEWNRKGSRFLYLLFVTLLDGFCAIGKQ